jgi:predicted protein tyrosine phosphatase
MVDRNRLESHVVCQVPMISATSAAGDQHRHSPHDGGVVFDPAGFLRRLRAPSEAMSISLIPPRLTICGIAELGEHSAAGVTHVLSILGLKTPDPPEFHRFAPHRRLVLRFHDVIRPRPDHMPPTREDVERLLAFGREAGEMPNAHLLVHCRAGVSRSTAAAALIVMQARPEWPASTALEAIAAIRPRAWPNLLILELGDELLGRNGEIAAAAGAIYRRVLERDPDFVAEMIEAGRDRELSAARRAPG